MTRVHFLPHQLCHSPSTSSDLFDISSVSSDQSNNDEPEESNYDADYANERAFFDDSDLVEGLGRLINLETSPLENTEDVDIFG